ncbi:MAG: hypothetical protein ACPHEN_07485 [Candidatus Poseidoniaceae archaeon]
MKQERETNKKDSYYNIEKEDDKMEMNAEGLSTKKKNERFLEALKTLSDQDPESFSEIAPELLQRCAHYWRGPDPFFSTKLNSWLSYDMMWKPFGEIIPDDANFSKRIESDAFDIKMYSGATKDLLESLQSRFPEDFNQWDASIRNQFIILGMIAMGREKGEYQGALVHRLGLGSGDVRIKGSNVIRAAKIALARLAKDNGADLFSPASGHGVERVHRMSSAKLAETIERFVLSHSASVLLPPPRSL